MTNYKCDDCANKNTPICELCKYTTTPSGKNSKPTYYVYLKDEVPDDWRHMPIDEALIRFITERKPMPIRWVMKYNKRVEKNRKGDENDV